MPIWRLQRHIVYLPSCQDTIEAWGIDRPAPSIPTGPAGNWTDVDDPLATACPLMVFMRDGSYVTWNRIWEFLSEIGESGYQTVSSLHKISPFSTIVIQK